LRAQDKQRIQGEFGIGLLSFWTVGETLSLISSGREGKSYEMRMAKGVPNYSVSPLRRLLADGGAELTVRPLLPGIRHFSGEKLQWYLAAELRDRIRQSEVEIRIIDRQARAEYRVEPRAFSGQLLHHLPVPVTPFGDVYVELYLAEPSPENHVGLYRSGTRVLENVIDVDCLRRPPWTSGYIQGVIDAPFLNLTPGTRLGVIHDERFAALLMALAELEASLEEIVRQQQQAAEEQASRDTLRSIQRAFREALWYCPKRNMTGLRRWRGRRRIKRSSVGIGGSPLVATNTESQTKPTTRQHPRNGVFGMLGRSLAHLTGNLCDVCGKPNRFVLSLVTAAAGRSNAIGPPLVVAEGAAVSIPPTESRGPDGLDTTDPAGRPGHSGRKHRDGQAIITVTDSLLPERPVRHPARIARIHV
jgi:hypothetical protein